MFENCFSPENNTRTREDQWNCFLMKRRNPFPFYDHIRNASQMSTHAPTLPSHGV